MNRLIKFYNQNRYRIWIVILVLIAVIALIQNLNKIALKKIYIDVRNENKSNISSINKNYSIVTGYEVKGEISKVIEQFINYCNNQEIEKAYEILSEDCKNTLYPSLEEFKKKYYDNIFTQKRNYVYQAWTTSSQAYTYKVDFVDDMLATGTPSKTCISDYYTIVRMNNVYKLNINKFISLENINKTQTQNNITINMIKKITYMDYEIYKMKIQNNLSKKIMLDNLKSTSAVYLQDENEQKYYWYNHEILETDITIKAGFNQEIEIKFNKGHNPSKKVTKMVFSNIVINNEDVIEFEIYI